MAHDRRMTGYGTGLLGHYEEQHKYEHAYKHKSQYYRLCAGKSEYTNEHVDYAENTCYRH